MCSIELIRFSYCTECVILFQERIENRSTKNEPIQRDRSAAWTASDLNLFFVLVCGSGVAGVALATSLSTAVSAGLVLFWLANEPGIFRFSPVSLRLDRAALKRMAPIGLSSAVQGAVFCFANLFVQADINRFGAAAIAGSTIATNFEYFGYFFITAFGQAAATFTSQNAAAGKWARCRRVLRLSIGCAAGFCALLTVPLTLWHSAASSVFSADPAVLAAAGVRILHILAFEPLCGLYEVPLRRDAGDRTRRTPGRADHPRHLSAAHRMEFYRI